jgi:hypothetical protein
LSRLLRLSLFQVAVGMALALLVGALNRVMIVELAACPPGLVAVMVALPVLLGALRALVGFRSDHHRSALGWRRVPFMWMGALLQFGGLALMPFTLLVLAGKGDVQSNGPRGSARPARPLPSCSSAQACTPHRQPAWRWPRISRPRLAPQGRRSHVRDAAGRHAGQRLGLRLVPLRGSPRAPGAGDSGLRAGHARAQRGSDVEAGAAPAGEPGPSAHALKRSPDFMVAWRTYVRHEAVRRRL